MSSSRFHAVDCEITHDRLKAGWVYIDGHLSPNETIREGEIEVSIIIPPDIQGLQTPSTFSFNDEPVEWMRSNVSQLA